MFNEISQPTIRVHTKQRYTVLVSVLAHVVALMTAAVIPLVATGVVPLPTSSWVDSFSAAPPPPPPVPPPAAPTDVPSEPVFVNSSDRVPFEAPATITDEPSPVIREVVHGIPRPLALSSGKATLSAPPPPARIRIGGEIRAPAKIFDARPSYPAIAKAARLSGIVFLEAVIATDGSVKDLRVTRSAGVFDSAAIDAVSRWKYTPTMMNGEAVEVVMSVTVNFTLN